MGGVLAIRRLRLIALAPHDHPEPGALEARLRDAARLHLAPALEKTLRDRRVDILRIRRLKLDLTLDAGFEEAGFARSLAEAAAAALDEAASGLDTDNVVRFHGPAAYVAGLVEALARGGMERCWWFADEEGLRFLPKPVAIRTALLAEPVLGQEALSGLMPHRLGMVLAALGRREAARAMDGFAASAPSACDSEAAAVAVGSVQKAEGSGIGVPALSSPLALYLRASAASGRGGPALAAAAECAAALTDERALRDLLGADPGALRGVARAAREAGGTALTELAARLGVASEDLTRMADSGEATETATRIALAKSNQPPRGVSAGVPEGAQSSRFAGLLLLAPGLEIDAIAELAAGWPGAAGDMAAWIGFAALGLCAGRSCFGAWLREPVWRALFGLDPGDTLAECAGAIPEAQWRALGLLGRMPETAREARFLLPPRSMAGPPEQAAARAAAHALTRLASAIASRFARRLIGLRAASAPFLWDNLLGAGGVFEPDAGGWRVRLRRPPLDVLISMSRLAEGSVRLPAGTVTLSRGPS
jgi:hypothetical protein